MDISSIDNYMNQIGSNAQGARASSVENSVSGLSPQSTYEELEEATKSFASYFVEQVIKEFKDSTSFGESDDEDPTMSQLTDYAMDMTIQQVASDMVNRSGNRLLTEWTNQMARNYGIDIPEDKKL